eukprot:gene220-2251_t
MADTDGAAGWESHRAMIPHLKQHCSGSLGGTVPATYLEQHKLCICQQCGALLAARHNGACPKCRPAVRAALRPRDTEEGNLGHAPTLSALPSPLEVHSARVSTQKYVPRAARAIWTECITTTLAGAVWHNTEAAWTELAMLPKAVLCAAPRAGKAHRQQAGTFTRLRCERWLAGERRTLWDDIPPRARGVAHPQTDRDAASDHRQRHARATELARDGLDSKACSALISSGLLNNTPEVLNALRSKHPTALPPDLSTLGKAPTAAVPEIDIETVRQAVLRFPRGSAPGPSGLRPQHLQDALKSTGGDKMLEQLSALTALLSRGEAPRSVAPLLAGATLFAIAKKDGGARPIAAGETYRRLTASCLCTLHRDAARDLLWPRQLGVAVPLGVEIGVHTARNWMIRNATARRKVAIKIDFRNAFNEVKRSKFLQAFRRDLPGFSPWMEWCYGNATHLFLNGDPSALRGDEAASQEGGQQGDPAAGLAFSLALQDILPRVAAAGANGIGKLDQLSFYLDDGWICGDDTAVARAFTELQRLSPEIGLTLNLGKCELIPAAGETSVFERVLFPPLGSLGDKDKITLKHNGNFELLGAAIGSAEWCNTHTQERVGKAQALLNEIGLLDDPQIALRLLRNCASFGKLVFSARVTEFGKHTDALTDFDTRVRSCFESFSGLRPTDTQWRRAVLSIRNGGLGLRRISDHAAAAWLSSCTTTAARCFSVDPAFTWDSGTPTSSIATAVRQLNAELPASHHIDLLKQPTPLAQHQLSSRLEECEVATMLDPATGLDERGRAQLRL